ncbi:MAG TPA: hypothetical protein VH518_10525, partial [Tepidisphaeraceae bacterium]
MVGDFSYRFDTCVLFATMFVVCSAPWPCAAGTPPDLDTILARCEQSLLRDQTFSAHYDLWQRQDRPWVKGKEQISWRYASIDFFQELGGRFAAHEKKWIDLPSQDAPLDPKACQVQTRVWLPAEGRFYSCVTLLEPSDDPKFRLEPGRITITTRTAKQADDWRHFDLDKLFHAQIGQDAPVPTFLRTVQCVLGRQLEPVNGFKCYVIHSVNKCGTFSVWIDPEHGYNIAKCEDRQDGHDLMGGQPLPRPGVTGGGAIIGGSSVYEVVRFENVADRWLPTEIRSSGETRWQGGTVGKTSSIAKCSRFTFTPDLDKEKAFELDFP